MIDFAKIGSGRKTLVFLHGWGKDKSSWDGVINLLKDKFTCYTLDLPGFGKSPLSKSHNLTDYVAGLTDFLKRGKITKPILIGHSFGGRIAIKTAVERPDFVDKLILIDSAGIERGTKLTKLIGLIKKTGIGRYWQGLAGTGRQIIGSPDYSAAGPILRETLKKVVAENLEFELPKIKVPTLIIWGENDHTTPLWMGELMHKQIPKSQFKIIPGGDHGVPYRRAEEVAKVIRNWIGGK